MEQTSMPYAREISILVSLSHKKHEQQSLIPFESARKKIFAIIGEINYKSRLHSSTYINSNQLHYNTKMSSWHQTTFSLSPKSKGSYLITDEVYKNVPQIGDYQVGILNLFLQHTSAGLTLNENCDPDVRTDMTTALDRIAPEGNHYIHADEGADDMPGHIKSSTIGVSLSIPITNGKLNTGTWQGIWLCEFRTYKHSRRIVATINGQKK